VAASPCSGRGAAGANAGEVASPSAGTDHRRSPLNTSSCCCSTCSPSRCRGRAGRHPVNGGVRGAGRGPAHAALWLTVTIRGVHHLRAATTAWHLPCHRAAAARIHCGPCVALVATQLGQTLLDSRSPLVVSPAIGALSRWPRVISTPGLSQLLEATPWHDRLSQALATASVHHCGSDRTPHR